MGKIDIVLGLATVLLEMLLAGFLAQRRLFSRFPFFFLFLCGSITIGIIRASFAANYVHFFVAFWLTFPVAHILIVLVLYEVFRQVFADYYEAWPWFPWLFPAVAILVIGLWLLYAFIFPPAQANRLIGVLLALGFAVNFMQLALFALFFFLVRQFGMWWRAYPYAIVMGFGFAALGASLPYLLRYDFGKSFNTVVKYMPPVAYIVAVIFWLDVFRRPEPDMNVKLPFHPAEALPVLRKMNAFLERIREDFRQS